MKIVSIKDCIRIRIEVLTNNLLIEYTVKGVHNQSYTKFDL